jgi:hypothetical protein
MFSFVINDPFQEDLVSLLDHLTSNEVVLSGQKFKSGRS